MSNCTLKSPIVAVAGGTGGFGRTIVEKLCEESSYGVVVLSRESDPKGLIPQGVTVIQVDYSDIDILAQMLEMQSIETIVSVISLETEEGVQSQLNLVQAAERSTVTRRFIPSEFSTMVAQDYEVDDQGQVLAKAPDGSLLPGIPAIKHFVDVANVLKKTSLEYTRVLNGMFMDFWGVPSIGTHLPPFRSAVDIANSTAVIPGHGDDVLSMTYSYDVAAFLVKILGLSNWPEFSIVVGDDFTYNEMVAAAERIRQCTFKVSYNSIEQLKSGDVNTVPPPPGVGITEEDYRFMESIMGSMAISGALRLPKENRLNTLLPDIRPLSLEDFLRKFWTHTP